MTQRVYMNPPVQPLHQPKKSNNKLKTNQKKNQAQFRDLLKQNVKKHSIEFSKHAEKRLASRKINLDGKRIKRLENAVDQAAEKGSNESLILMDDVAYVVSVKNRTVITAVDDGSMQDNVFTNIDSAVIVK